MPDNLLSWIYGWITGLICGIVIIRFYINTAKKGFKRRKKWIN